MCFFFDHYIKYLNTKNKLYLNLYGKLIIIIIISKKISIKYIILAYFNDERYNL